MGTKPQGNQGTGKEPIQNPHFVRTLRFFMTRRGMGPHQLVRELGRMGLYVDDTAVLALKRGCGSPQWDRLVPALQDIFGHPAVDWLASIGRYGLPVLDCVPQWGVNLQNQEWGLRLQWALAKHDVSRRELATWLQSVGFAVGPSTVQDWTKGSVPLDGISILPWISKLLRVPLESLIPDESTTPGSGGDPTEPDPPDTTPYPEEEGYR